jgi:hypothetical protein
MRIRPTEIPVKVDAPGATVRLLPDFGTASGTLGAEFFDLDAGTDLGPLMKGLEGDACQSAHWGYLVDGEVTVSYSDGTTERCSAGDVIYWPPGHSVRAEQPSRFVLFSPVADHGPVFDHVLDQLAAAAD